MAEPTDIEDYNAKYMRNMRMTGHGLDVMMHQPCPFCAEPEFAVFPVLQMEKYMSKPQVCKHCGRGAKCIFEHSRGDVKMEIVQTSGDPPFPYLPPMRRTDQ